jgi:predicted amidohydrolase YtcJ
VKQAAAILILAMLPALGAELYPDLVLIDGKIWTVNPAQPEAEAVACLNGMIAAVGSTAEIRKLIGPHTRVVDLRGKRVVPGFNDAHVHFYSGGFNLTSVQLRDARSQAEFRDRIRDFAAKQPSGRWITGGEWDHESWSPAKLPARQLVDDVTGDHPLFVQRLDGHMGLANSLALKLAGITRETPDRPGGTIVHDSNGEPTGILKDAAMEPVLAKVPADTPEQMAESVQAAVRYAAQNGVTSVQDMSASPDVLSVYQQLLERGALTVRIYGHQPIDSYSRLVAVGIRAGLGNNRLKIGAVKGFADGSLGSTTALFYEPYLDEPNTSGLANEDMIPESKMLDRVTAADAAGLQVAVHAIGDKANAAVLKIFAKAGERNGPRDRRFRIEHAQHLRPEEIRAFADQRVVASMQPYHAIDDGRWAEKRIGAERAKLTYAFRSLLDAGVTLAFGSDWDVAPMEPLMGIYAAATRRTLDGKHSGGWIPEQKITVAEAVRAYTMGSAFASFDEKIKGSIEPGKLADLAVLSDDILHISPERIDEVRVSMTVFDGKVIYERR